jgi:hypothetical protein
MAMGFESKAMQNDIEFWQTNELFQTTTYVTACCPSSKFSRGHIVKHSTFLLAVHSSMLYQHSPPPEIEKIHY